ncbi:MAG TPA: RNA 2',3'-cyclic phosphodiesterase [Candidatus Acidoferrales bacterium]|nr:RNA 2',3'-cyclic phosphodiesterase [Candidatus Acidoferrales bacterium]
MIRAFIGVRLEPEVTAKIADVQRQLRERIPGVRWVEQANFHFTLKFLGPVAEERIPRVAQALRELLGDFCPFVVSARGIGVFPDIRRPRVLWVGLGSDKLEPLAMAVEQKMEAAGFEREERPFRPHLTLGRWREAAKASVNVRAELERWKEENFGNSLVKEVILFQSTLRPGGAVYSELELFHLAAPPQG